jgi:antitoxin StbD
MQTILTDLSISMSDFKKNPAQVLRTAGEQPVAVLNHNRPAFYMLSPKLFEALIEEVADRELLAIVKRRLERVDDAVEVDLDSL